VDAVDAGELLTDQIGYYRRRASEYDRDMWQRNSSDAALAALFDAADRWFARLPVRGRVLELGCGTGAWTVPLASRAGSVVAVDAAPEMLQVAADRISAHDNVELIEADLFDWTHPAASRSCSPRSSTRTSPDSTSRSSGT
jgi:cyclopropane fatty-acyl-phospholipid synthase-like methyltransferase